MALRLLVDEECGPPEGDVASSSSLSGMGFPAGDLGGGVGEVEFSLPSLLGGSGVTKSFSAGEENVCVCACVCKHTDGVCTALSWSADKTVVEYSTGV